MLKEIFRKLLHNDWFAALILFVVFLAKNGYTYGWDDQHLEIPLLKALIDPSLYPGDYYVGSLKHAFPSLLYPLLAKIISIEQIPATYFVLFLISRYFFFFWDLLHGHMGMIRSNTAFTIRRAPITTQMSSAV